MEERYDKTYAQMGIGLFFGYYYLSANTARFIWNASAQVSQLKNI